jgi:hypothetical protein
VVGQRHGSASLSPGRRPWYPLYRRLGGSQDLAGRVRKISPPPGFDPPTVQAVASRYTDWAIPAPPPHTVYIYKILTNWKKCTNCERYKRPLCAVRTNEILCNTKPLLNFYSTETNVQQQTIVLLCTVLNHSHFQLWNNFYKNNSECSSLDLDKNV